MVSIMGLLLGWMGKRRRWRVINAVGGGLKSKVLDLGPFPANVRTVAT
jgi:hypothetical protein